MAVLVSSCVYILIDPLYKPSANEAIPILYEAIPKKLWKNLIHTGRIKDLKCMAFAAATPPKVATRPNIQETRPVVVKQSLTLMVCYF